MAKAVVEPGRLYALDGIPPAELAAQGKRLLKRMSSGPKSAGGVSSWDSSGLFHELARGGFKHGSPSPKTLLLLYAADLEFRLRWEIRPALEAGKDVVAAPYVETAVAFGTACGIDARWTAELLSFAPRAEASYALSARPGKAKQPAGFVDFGLWVLAGNSDRWKREDLRKAVAERLVRPGGRSDKLKGFVAR